MIDEFNDFSVNIDSDVLSQDFDTVDLYGDKIEENNTDSLSEEIQYE